MTMIQIPFNPEKYWEFLLVWVNIFQTECKRLDNKTSPILNSDKF